MNSTSHKQIFKSILTPLVIEGQKTSPRGLEVLELENYSYNVPPYVRFMNFNIRHLNIDYIKTEFLWYLKGDRYDVSIADHAKIWQSIMNPDGSFNSNYGQYFFGEQKQFDTIVSILAEDKDSRRASVLLLTKEHVCSETKDVPCTYAVNFRIRNNHLNMTVRMRSQDAIYGMGNDLPTFSFIHEMMLNALREYYPDLEYGMYHHSVDSFHVYARHYDMLNEIVALQDDDELDYRAHHDEYTPVDCPQISGPDEVRFLRALNFETIPDAFHFTKWLTSPTC